MSVTPRPQSDDWLEPRPLGRSGVSIGRLGLGLGLVGPDPERNRRLIRRASEVGIRYLDVAPSYGSGVAEERLGENLAALGRDRVVVSTKAGQLIRVRSRHHRLIHAVDETITGGQAGLRLVRGRLINASQEVSQGVRERHRRGWSSGAESSPKTAVAATHETPRVRPMSPICDYSYDGVMRSFEESLRRLATDRVDIVYMHDPGIHRRQAVREAYRALHDLRRNGAIRALGVSMNDGRALAWFAERGDFDVFLLAGRYTLLDQSGAESLFPVTAARGIGLIVAGVFNGGLLADPVSATSYNWGPVRGHQRERALCAAEVCRRHAVDLKAAALQFAFANPAVSTLLLGATSAEELDECLELLQVPIPEALWAELTHLGFIQAGMPVPTGAP